MRCLPSNTKQQGVRGVWRTWRRECFLDESLAVATCDGGIWNWNWRGLHESRQSARVSWLGYSTAKEEYEQKKLPSELEPCVLPGASLCRSPLRHVQQVYLIIACQESAL